MGATGFLIVYSPGLVAEQSVSGEQRPRLQDEARMRRGLRAVVHVTGNRVLYYQPGRELHRFPASHLSDLNLGAGRRPSDSLGSSPFANFRLPRT